MKGTTSIVFPVQNEILFRTLTSLAIFLGLSIMSFCFAHRTLEIGLFTKRGLRSLTFPRFLLVTLLIWSWSFILCCGILIHGVGASLNVRVCDAVVLTCLFLYFTSKGLLYMILIERVYIVWPHRGTRRSSTVFKLCVVVLMGFFVFLFVGMHSREARIRDDLQCEIGLDRVTTITAAVYDVCACSALAGLFVWPLLRHTGLSPALRRVATRTIVANLCCLSMTLVNLVLLARDDELGWMCLLICCLDICGNTLVLFWLTRSNSKFRSQPDRSTQPQCPIPSNGACSRCGAVNSGSTNVGGSNESRQDKRNETFKPSPPSDERLRSPRALEEGTASPVDKPQSCMVDAGRLPSQERVGDPLSDPISPLTYEAHPPDSTLRMTHFEERCAIDNAFFHAPRRIEQPWKSRWTWSMASDAHGERRPSTPGGVLGRIWGARRPSETGERSVTSLGRARANEVVHPAKSKSEATLCSLNVMVSVKTINDALEDSDQLYEDGTELQEPSHEFFHAI